MSLTRRLMTTATSSSSAITISQVPETISSTQLPKTIFRYVQNHLRTRGPDPIGDPTLPQIAAPDHAGSSFPLSINVPNPFILQKSPITLDRADGGVIQTNRYKFHFPKRQQKKLLALHSRYHLPPSLINPIVSPPRVIWEHEGSHFGKEISWQGDWAEIKKKGMYHGRKVMFKGHKRERDRPEKHAVTAERVVDMPRRVDEWRATKAKAKSNVKPSLPF